MKTNFIPKLLLTNKMIFFTKSPTGGINQRKYQIGLENSEIYLCDIMEYFGPTTFE